MTLQSAEMGSGSRLGGVLAERTLRTASNPLLTL
jgi:hypothetical protein